MLSGTEVERLLAAIPTKKHRAMQAYAGVIPRACVKLVRERTQTRTLSVARDARRVPFPIEGNAGRRGMAEDQHRPCAANERLAES